MMIEFRLKRKKRMVILVRDLMHFLLVHLKEKEDRLSVRGKLLLKDQMTTKNMKLIQMLKKKALNSSQDLKIDQKVILRAIKLFPTLNDRIRPIKTKAVKVTPNHMFKIRFISRISIEQKGMKILWFLILNLVTTTLSRKEMHI